MRSEFQNKNDTLSRPESLPLRLCNGNYEGWLSEHRERCLSSTHRLSSKRWCVLQGKQLFVYDSQCEEKAAKILHLPEFQVKLIAGGRDDNVFSQEGMTSGEMDCTTRAVDGQYLFELRPEQATKGSDVYVFAAETEEEFNNWSKLLCISASLGDPVGSSAVSSPGLSPQNQLKAQHSPSLTVNDEHLDNSTRPHQSTLLHQNVRRTISEPYTQQRAEVDLQDILKKADYSFWEDSKDDKSLLNVSMESCLLAPSTKKSPGNSPPTVRRSDMRWASLPVPRIKSPTHLDTNGSVQKRLSLGFGSSWDGTFWGSKRSPKSSPKAHRKSLGLFSLSQADFEDSYGIFEARSSQSHKKEVESGDHGITSQENIRSRSATGFDSPTSSSEPHSPEEQSTGLKPAQFNRTLSFLTRMKEGNKRKRKMRQIPITADDIVKPAKTGFVKMSSKGMTSSIKRCYAVLKDEWLYLYKKPTDTCTLDAYDMPSYVVSANVSSLGIRSFRNQKLAISLEHKVMGDVSILTAEAHIEIFEWAKKLQKASKEQGLMMDGLNLEQGRRSSKTFISAPLKHPMESSSQSKISHDKMAELHRHRLIQQAMRENQQIILGTQRVKDVPEQFPLGPGESPTLQRKKDKLETEFDKASEQEEQQAMRDLTILKKRRISAQVKQDTILRQLGGKKKKQKEKHQQEYAAMRQQLDQLKAKLGTIDSEIMAQSQFKEKRLQAIKDRKAIELQILEQRNELLRYRRATQEALEDIMEKSPIQRQSLSHSADDSSDDEKHATHRKHDPFLEKRSSSKLYIDSTPGISLQRPSIDVGIPGAKLVLQRASLELQIGSQQTHEVPVQSQNAPVQSQNAPTSDLYERGSGLGKTKHQLLPATPGSPDSLRSGGSGSTNSPSGTESDNELQIAESAVSNNNNIETFRSYKKSRSSPTGIRNAQLKGHISDHSSHTTSDSGSDSPQEGRNERTNLNRSLSKGISLPDIHSVQKVLSMDSTSSMDIASDDSPEIDENSKSRNKCDEEDYGGSCSSNEKGTSNTHPNNSEIKPIDAIKHGQSDTNGNHVTSTSIYLRPSYDRRKSKAKPLSENPDSQGLRTEISPEVLKDIEEFEMIARRALWEAGWQIPI